MKRIPILLTALAAIAAVLSATVQAKAKPKPKPPAGTKVQLLSTSDRGKILADKSGFVLYAFSHDTKNTDTCVKIKGCTGTWPVLSTKAKPVAGKGVKSSLLGTITLAHGVKQVTYAGHPVYRYNFASGPNDESYVGTPEFGGTWEALSAAGKLIK